MDPETAIRRVYAAIDAGDFDAMSGLMHDEFVDHEEIPGFAPTREGVVDFFRMTRGAFPDLRMEVDGILVSGDTAVARGRMTGTHRGEYMGVPAGGRSVDVPLIDIIRFDDAGLAVEHWGVFDAMRLMQQMGAVPGG